MQDGAHLHDKLLIEVDSIHAVLLQLKRRRYASDARMAKRAFGDQSDVLPRVDANAKERTEIPLPVSLRNDSGRIMTQSILAEVHACAPIRRQLRNDRYFGNRGRLKLGNAEHLAHGGWRVCHGGIGS